MEKYLGNIISWLHLHFIQNLTFDLALFVYFKMWYITQRKKMLWRLPLLLIPAHFNFFSKSILAFFFACSVCDLPIKITIQDFFLKVDDVSHSCLLNKEILH